MDVATVRYDKDGDDHYDVISAFIKSMRGSDPDATMHYPSSYVVVVVGPGPGREPGTPAVPYYVPGPRPDYY